MTILKVSHIERSLESNNKYSSSPLDAKRMRNIS
jgi:hypothetical protein